MKLSRMAVFVMVAACLSGAGWAELSSRLEDGRLWVEVGGKPFTAYNILPSQKYPYFFPVNGPVTGESVTTETSDPYPHHRSLFFGCDRVNGGNYWQDGVDKGRIVSEGLDLLQERGDKIVFRDRCRWERPGAAPVMRDERLITVSAPSENLRQIDFDITLIPMEDVRIEKTNHSLFAARMVPALSVAQGGVLVNAEGGLKEEGTFGKASPWCDYSGVRDGKAEGLAILQHPSNPWHPAPWFTRDYGFFSPTPMFWPENGTHIDLPKGEAVRLRYRVLVHAGDAATADIAAGYAGYAGEE